MLITAHHAHAYTAGHLITFPEKYKLSVHQNQQVKETWYIITTQRMTTGFPETKVSSYLEPNRIQDNVNMQTKYHSACHVLTISFLSD